MFVQMTRWHFGSRTWEGAHPCTHCPVPCAPRMGAKKGGASPLLAAHRHYTGTCLGRDGKDGKLTHLIVILATANVSTESGWEAWGPFSTSIATTPILVFTHTLYFTTPAPPNGPLGAAPCFAPGWQSKANQASIRGEVRTLIPACPGPPTAHRSPADLQAVPDTSPSSRPWARAGHCSGLVLCMCQVLETWFALHNGCLVHHVPSTLATWNTSAPP